MNTQFEDFLKGIKNFKKQNGYYQIEYQTILDRNNEETLNAYIARINEAVISDYLVTPPNEYRKKVELRHKDGSKSYDLHTQVQFTSAGEKLLNKSWFNWKNIVHFILQLLAAG